jgi:hypothetical protein
MVSQREPASHHAIRDHIHLFGVLTDAGIAEAAGVPVYAVTHFRRKYSIASCRTTTPDVGAPPVDPPEARHVVVTLAAGRPEAWDGTDWGPLRDGFAYRDEADATATALALAWPECPAHALPRADVYYPPAP